MVRRRESAQGVTARVHLIVGNVGAGKSTYAAKLGAERRAHIFANDPLFRELFAADLPNPPAYEWTLERTQRIERVCIAESRKMLALERDVILDLGFFERSQRDRVRRAFADGVALLHHLDVDAEERWRRVDRRNRERGETYDVYVDRDTFDFCETIFEPLDEDERGLAVIV